MALLWLQGRELGNHTKGPRGDWFDVVGCIPYSDLRTNPSPYMLVSSLSKVSLVCWLISSDVSVSALRARPMSDVVGTVVFVEELAISRPANQTSHTLASAGESLVVGRATLESVSLQGQ